MTDTKLQEPRKNAKDNGYTNVEFRKDDIEKRIPVDANTADLVISLTFVSIAIIILLF